MTQRMQEARLAGRRCPHHRLDMVVAVRIDDGLVTGLYTVRNSEKLSRVQRETTVSR